MRTPNEPNIVVMYVIVGVVAVVIFSFVVVVLVIFLLRKKRPSCSLESGSSHQRAGERREREQLDTKLLTAAHLDSKLLNNQLNLYSGIGRDGGCSGPESSGEGGGGSPDIFDYLPSTRDCYMRGYQPSPSRLSPATLSSVLENGAPESGCATLEGATHPPREQGDGAEGVLERPEPLYAESTKRTRKQFCPSSLIEAEYCRVSSLRKVAPPTLPKPCKPPENVEPVAPPHPYGPALLEEEKRVRNCTTV